MTSNLKGFPGCEFQAREALAEVLGDQKAEFFWEKVCQFLTNYFIVSLIRQYLEYFFGEPDAVYFKSLGLNCIRIAVNYRHFEGRSSAYRMSVHRTD